MNLIEASQQELIDSILKFMVTPNIQTSNHPDKEEELYLKFISDVNKCKDASVQLPLDFAIRNDLFNLIKNQIVFVESSVKFTTTFTTKKPVNSITPQFNATYCGNEFAYSFLDNHPGIINVDKIKDIPVDYEGFMAVPPTILEYKNLSRFNVYRVLYAPRFCGKAIYPRIVVSNKFTAAN